MIDFQSCEEKIQLDMHRMQLKMSDSQFYLRFGDEFRISRSISDIEIHMGKILKEKR